MKIAPATLALLLALCAAPKGFADDPPPPKVEKPDTSAEVESSKSYAVVLRKSNLEK